MTPVEYTELLKTIETKLAAATTRTQIKEIDLLFNRSIQDPVVFEASEDKTAQEIKAAFEDTTNPTTEKLNQALETKTAEIEAKHKVFENLPNQADAVIANYEANLNDITSMLTSLNAMEHSETLSIEANDIIEDTKSKEKAALEKLQNDLNAKLMAAKAEQAKVQTFIKNVTEAMHNYLSKKSLHHFRPVRGEMSGKERLSNVGKNILQFFSAIWSNLKTVLKRAFTSYNKADEDKGPTNTRFESRKFDIALASGLLDQFENKYSARYEKISDVASVLSQLSKNLKWTANSTEQSGFPNGTLNQASNLGEFTITTNSLSLFSQRDKGQKSGRVNVRRELDAEVTTLTNIVTAPTPTSPSSV